MEDNDWSVYAIIDGTNDFEYIGQTTRSVEERFKEHTKADSRIGYAIRAHGEDMFIVVVLKVCHSKDELDYWEQRLIKSRNTKHPNGYNMTDGGDGCTGFTPELRKKMSEARRGKSLSSEHCAHISEALKGKTFTPERCAHIAEALKGRSLSPEHRKKISASGKGKKLTPEHCAKIAAALTGVPKSHEHRIRTSLARRTYSPFKNLLAELDARKLSYTDLAKLMGFATTASISEKLRCERNFTERDKVKLVEIFGKPIEYLLARD